MNWQILNVFDIVEKTNFAIEDNLIYKKQFSIQHKKI